MVVGRANWQFCGSAEGGRTAAALYSVVGTCKHLGIDPFTYLRNVLPALFGLGDRPGDEALAELLPDVWQKRQPNRAEARAPESTSEAAPPASEGGRVGTEHPFTTRLQL